VASDQNIFRAKRIKLCPWALQMRSALIFLGVTDGFFPLGYRSRIGLVALSV